MLNNPPQNGKSISAPEDMINASELREFVFCERAWFLSRKGFRVSSQALEHRAAGIEFHEARAGAASRGQNPRTFWLAMILASIGIAILFFRIWTAIR